MSLTVRYRFHPSRPAVSAQPGVLDPAMNPWPVATKAARFLALGHAIDQAVRRRDLPSHAAAARQLGITEARVSQIVQLTLLAPDIQERILAGELPVSTRALRPIAKTPDWAEQRRELVAHIRQGRSRT